VSPYATGFDAKKVFVHVTAFPDTGSIDPGGSAQRS
jgi:hypothetical protein